MGIQYMDKSHVCASAGVAPCVCLHICQKLLHHPVDTAILSIGPLPRSSSSPGFDLKNKCIQTSALNTAPALAAHR